MFDKATLAQLEANYRAMQPKQAAQKPQPKKRSLIQALLPAAGATVAGLAAAPFTGGLSLLPTLGIIGGAAAAGGAAGEFGAQKSAGEQTNVGKIAKEATLSGVLGAGGQAFTAARAAKTAGAGSKSLVDALTDAKAYQGIKDTAKAAKSTGRVARTVNDLKSNVINPKTQASVFGAGEDQAIVKTVDKYVQGITASQKYKNLGTAMKGISADIEKTLAPITKKTTAVDLTKRLTTNLADNINYVPGDAAYERELTRVLNKVVSFGKNGEVGAADLFKAKQYLGTQLKGAFGKSGTDLTVPQQVRMAVWENLDDAITTIAPKVKDLTNAQSYLIKAAPGLQQATKKTVGVPMFGVKSKILANGLQRGEYGLANALQRGSRVAGAVGPTMGAAAAQTVPRAIGGGYELNSPTTQPITDNTMANTTIPASISNMPESYQNFADNSTNPLDPENLQSSIQTILANGGTIKDANEFVSLATALQKLQPSTAANKPLSAEAAKVVSNAQTGIQALRDFQAAIDQDPSVLSKRAIPGRGLLGGALGGALGTRGADAAAAQIVDVIARLRTGAAITNDEAKRFEAFIPQAFDPPDVRQQKINYLMKQFQMVADRGVAPSPSSLEEALLAS
jgi:hypothetical protein